LNGCELILASGYIMRAVASHERFGTSATAVTFVNAAMEIIHGGNELAQHVAVEHRGTVFSRSFGRGVKAFLLEAFTKVCRRVHLSMLC